MNLDINRNIKAKKKTFEDNHFHNILRLFDILTISELPNNLRLRILANYKI